jgi:hypothetical protein
MSVYPPPSFEEYLPVFNPADWGAGSATIDIAYLDSHYLRYPVAQGTENFVNANFSDRLTFTAPATSISAGFDYKTYSGAGTAGLYTLPLSSYNSSTSITNASITGITLPPVSSKYYGTPLYIQNTLNTAITITSSSGNFVGEYSTGGATVTLTPNTTFGFYLDSGSANAWNVFYSSGGDIGLVDIRSYGAVGDGATNCTTAINNAIASLSAGNKTLYIPQGQYKITATLLFSGLTNVNVFSEGTIFTDSVTGFSLIGLTNCTNFSINGNLVLNGGFGIADGIYIYNLVADDLVNISLNNLNIVDCAIGINYTATGFKNKTINNPLISNCVTGVRADGEYCQVVNSNIYDCTNGAVVVGGNNTFIGGMIKACDYGMIVAYQGIANPDHNGCYDLTFNHNVNCALVLSDIRLSWIVKGCNFWANGTSAIGDPLSGSTPQVVATAFQSLFCSVYFQGVKNVILDSCVFGNTGSASVGSHLVLNGGDGLVVTNNVFRNPTFYTGGYYINVVGNTTTGQNTNYTISGNECSGLSPAQALIRFADPATYATACRWKIANNVGGLQHRVIDTSVTGNVYIDGTVENYTIVEGTTAVIYLTNVVANYSIVYRRTGTYDYTLTPVGTNVLILAGSTTPTIFPTLCDGLTRGADIGGLGVVQFLKEATYTISPTLNSTDFVFGNYTFFQTVKDFNLTYTPTLSASTAVNLNSPLFYNSTVVVTTALPPTPNTNITLPTPVVGVNTFYSGSAIRIFNNTVYTLTLNATSGNFTGAYGNNQTTISLQDNTWYSLTTNGTTWEINERSANITYTLNTISANISYAVYYNLTNANIRISASGAPAGVPYILTIPTPSDQQVHTTTTKFLNTGSFPISLSIGGGVFGGIYGSGLTTYLLPANNWVEVFSNGTDYLIQDRSSPTYKYFLGSSTLTFGNNILDANLSISPPDDNSAIGALSATPNLTGTATQAGVVLTVVTITAGTLSAGSVMAFSGNRIAIVSQLTGTAGGVGTYIVNFSQTVASTTAWSIGYYNTTTVMTGTASQTVISSTTTNQPRITIDTISSGGNNLTNGTVLSVATANNPYQYITSQVSGTTGGTGVYSTTAINTAVITTQAFFATSAGRVNLPAPSNANFGKRITIFNNSFVPVNITTVAGSNIFGGLYGQQNNSANSLAQATNDTQYLLRIGKTVVLQSDATNWNAVEGTTLTGSRTFWILGNLTSNTTDGNNTDITAVYPYNTNDFNCLGVQLQNTGRIYNSTGFPITVQVSAQVNWSGPVITTGTIIATRFFKFFGAVNTVSANNSYSGQGQNVFFNPVPSQVLTAGTFTYSGILNQAGSYTITLQPTEGFGMQFGKYNGSATGEVITSGVINVTRIA